MFETVFTSIYSELTLTTYVLCSLSAIVLGAVLAIIYSRLNKTTESLIATVILLPFVVQTVLMLVGGSLGTSVAIMGVFGLIRFKSLPYKAHDLLILFASVAIGLATSVGYVGLAAVFTLIICLSVLVFAKINLYKSEHRELRITVPEGLDYEGEFCDILNQYANEWTLTSVKTSNMGSLFRLTYDIVLRNPRESRNFIDELRIRNSNLEISISQLPESIQ